MKMSPLGTLLFVFIPITILAVANIPPNKETPPAEVFRYSATGGYNLNRATTKHTCFCKNKTISDAIVKYHSRCTTFKHLSSCCIISIAYDVYACFTLALYINQYRIRVYSKGYDLGYILNHVSAIYCFTDGEHCFRVMISVYEKQYLICMDVNTEITPEYVCIKRNKL